MEVITVCAVMLPQTWELQNGFGYSVL